MLIYINRNGQQLGSFTIEKINLGLASGQFLPTDLAFYEGLPQWTQLNNIQGVAIPTVAPIVPPASQAPLPRRPWYSILFIVCGCIGISLSIIAFVVLANERPRIENIVLAIVFPLGTLGSFFFAWLTKKTNEVTEYLRHLANK